MNCLLYTYTQVYPLFALISRETRFLWNKELFPRLFRPRDRISVAHGTVDPYRWHAVPSIDKKAPFTFAGGAVISTFFRGEGH
jgi:hypothetical protein